MIPQADITAWRAIAPWQDDAQVEQDLVLSRALVALFADAELAGMVALRGGASLNKLYLEPAARYSEDIDLVQTHGGPIGPLLDAIRARLDSWLGKAKSSRAAGSAALIYRFASEIPPLRPLRLKIEINTREHFSVLGLQRRRLAVVTDWYSQEAEVTTYALDELLGTKLRALYQRRKGRDLFDLWLCISRKLIDPKRVIESFGEYMKREGHLLLRADFERNLEEKRKDPAFLGDIRSLLNSSIEYEPASAIDIVLSELVERLPRTF